MRGLHAAGENTSLVDRSLDLASAYRKARLHKELFQSIYLFTDASFDPIKGAGLGAVLISGAERVDFLVWISFG